MRPAAGWVSIPPGAVIPEPTQSEPITALLRAWQAGDAGALERLTPLVYGDLRRIAARALLRERRTPTLQPTLLVHEAFLRLAEQRAVDWRERAQLFALAARLMRRILVDHARARAAAKRQAPLLLAEPAVYPRGAELLALDAALARLADHDPEQSRIVELRFFGGLSVEEVAEVLGLSPRTVARQWAVARAWLFGELQGRETAGESR